MKTVKKALGIILCLIMIISAMPFNLTLAAKEEAPIAIVESADGSDVYFVDANGNKVPDAPYADIPDDSKDIGDDYDVNLPTSYDARNYGLVTSVKNQGSAGCCWAFSSISALETSAIKQGFADVNTVDLAESHLANFAHNSKSKIAGDPMYGDGEEQSAEEIYAGGNYADVTRAWAKGSGAVNDSAYYDFFTNYNNSVVLPESDRYQCDMHLADSSLIDCFSEEDLDTLIRDVKEAILANGSVMASYKNYYELYKDNGTSTGFYQNTSTKTSHAINICGWDDNYAVTNFTTQPPAPGAWLVKNSWDNDWGTDGYFYLSYYDTSVSKFNAFKAENVNAYDNIYQYDGVGYHWSWNYSAEYSDNATPKMANVFTAENDEYISKAGIWTSRGNTKYIIYIYTDLTNNSNPTSGTLACKLTGSAKYTGYHTVPLQKLVKVDAGEKFSVCTFYYSESEETAYYLTEGPAEEGYNSEAGVSFYKSGTSWKDTHNGIPGSGKTYDTNNVPIKAMTIDCENHNHTFGPATIITQADCMTEGIITAECTACGYVKTENIGKDSYNHIGLVTDEAVAADCIHSGLTAGTHCEACHEVVAPQVFVPATGIHNYTAKVTSEYTMKTPATCTAPAEYFYSCSVCGQIEYNDSHLFTSGNSGSHDWIWETDIEPTCGEPGTKYQYCINCGSVRNEGTVIPATGNHTWGEGVTTLNSTCTENGKEVYTCTVCGQTKEENLPLNPENHGSYGTYTSGAYAGNCKTQGYTGDLKCAGCNNTLATGEYYYGDHDYEWKIDLNPTCLNTGLKHRECKFCGDKTDLNTVMPKSSDHNYEWITDREPTCGEAGIKHRECAVCGNKQNINTAIPATGKHTWGEGYVIAEATCRKEGQMGYNCTKCGAEKTEPIAKTNHRDSDGDEICDDCGIDLAPGRCPYCHKVHSGAFGWLTELFHKILYAFRNLFNR